MVSSIKKRGCEWARAVMKPWYWETRKLVRSTGLAPSPPQSAPSSRLPSLIGQRGAHATIKQVGNNYRHRRYIFFGVLTLSILWFPANSRHPACLRTANKPLVCILSVHVV